MGNHEVNCRLCGEDLRGLYGGHAVGCDGNTYTQPQTKYPGADTSKIERNMLNVTLTEYWDILNRHDWTYEFSDAPSVYRRGRAAQQALENISDTSPAHKSLFLAFRDHSYYHPSRGPKPERPSE